MKKTVLAILLPAVLAMPLVAQQFERRIEAEPGGMLEVDLETGGSVTVGGWGENLVLVQVMSGKDDSGDSEIKIEKTDRGVQIEAEGAGFWKKRSRGYDLAIKVPSVYDLEIETMGGDIEVSNVQGDLEGKTMGGEVRLTGLKGEISFETMGGRMELTDSDVDGELETMGGQVVVENVTGDVDGSSMGGSVVYKNVTRRSGQSTGEAVIISTMGGDLEIGSAPAGAQLETMGGDITVGDAGKFVDAETMGGDIVIGSVEGWVKAETMGGDVEVTVVGDPQAEERDIEISSMAGDIHLTVPRNFSMEVDIEISYDPKKGRRIPQIHSDEPLSITTEEDKGGLRRDHGATIRGKGSFNGGRNKVEIDTVEGDVYLEYAS